MPRKPTQEVIDAAKAKLDPREVLQVIISETPELRNALVDAKLVTEIKEDDNA